MHPVLQRLDDLARHLASRADAVALLGVGSAGVEHARLDEHSDLDFFVVVEDAAKERYLASVDWLEGAGRVAYSFVNSPDGRKALLAGGVFVEYAVFTVGELARVPFTGARVVWQRADAPEGLARSGPPLPRPALDTVDFHLNEALTNLYVGLHRDLRGERLSATRFIQSHAVDRVIALLRLTGPSDGSGSDPFDPARRVEQAYPPQELPLAAMVPGYLHNREAAGAVFAWLGERFEIDPVIGAAVTGLLGRG